MVGRFGFVLFCGSVSVVGGNLVIEGGSCAWGSVKDPNGLLNPPPPPHQPEPHVSVRGCERRAVLSVSLLGRGGRARVGSVPRQPLCPMKEEE